MDQFYSVLSSWWKGDPYDVLTMNIISALPLEIAVIILRLLDPRSLCAAMLVNKSWLSLVRSDRVLRARVHGELVRQRRAYWALIDGPVGAGLMPNSILDAVYYQHLHKLRPQASTRRTKSKTVVPAAATVEEFATVPVAAPVRDVPAVQVAAAPIQVAAAPVQAAAPTHQGAARPLATRRPPFVATSPFPAPRASSTPNPSYARKQHALKAARHRPSAQLREKTTTRKSSCLRI